eukprot:676636-Amphidinium_carterae.1
MSPLTRVPGETWVPLPSSPASRKLAGREDERAKRQQSRAVVHYQHYLPVRGPVDGCPKPARSLRHTTRERR